MSIHGEHFDVEVEGARITIKGVMRLNGIEEYKQVLDLFHKVAEDNGEILIDISRLNLLNSSGITTLCKFAIHCRKNNLQLSLKWSESISWQSNSVKNLQRLLPTLKLIV
jgi:hypothetical protein